MNLQVIKGSLLGDMWIQKFKKPSNFYSINFQQSEYDYSRWKAEMCGVPYTLSKNKKYDSRTNKEYYFYHVYLKLDKFFKKKLYSLFYNPKKEVSRELLNTLSPLSITIWYLDDGNIYYNGNNCHLTLSTNGFNDISRQNIIEYFRESYQLNFKVTGKGAVRITSRREVELFMKVVEKFIPSCMRRKTLKFQMKRYDNTLTDEQRKYRNKKYN